VLHFYLKLDKNLGVTRQLAGRAFRYKLFGVEKSLKRFSAAIPNTNVSLNKIKFVLKSNLSRYTMLQ